MAVIERSVFVTRHGHRADLIGHQQNAEWIRTAKRPHDPPLSELGMLQAQRLGERVKSERIDYVFASPFLRTVQTGDAVARVLGIPCRVETALHEWLRPEWFKTSPDMLPLATLKGQCPSVDLEHVCTDDLAYPEVEEESEVFPRVRRCVDRLLRQYPGNLMLVGHGASVMGMCSYFGALEGISCQMACLIRYDLAGGKWERTLSGCTQHLLPDAVVPAH